jgi:TRAP transporter TAXI family solute receptor
MKPNCLAGRRSRRSLAVLATLVVIGLAAFVPAAGAEPPDTLRLATGSVGGTFLPVGYDLAVWFSTALPEIVVRVDTTAGSVENLDRLVSGDADLAIVGSSPFGEVLHGWRPFSDEAGEICTLGNLYVDAEQFVVRGSLVRVGNLLDLNGLKMYPGPYNSGAEIDTRRLLTALGIEPRYVYVEERDKGYAATAEALARGDFDAATFSGGVPIQAVTDLFRRHPGEFLILPFTRHMLLKIRHNKLDFEGVKIRKGRYPGQTEDIQTVGGPNLLVAAPGLPRETLIALDQAIRDGIAEPGVGLRVSASHPVLQALTVEHWEDIPVGEWCLEAEERVSGSR